MLKFTRYHISFLVQTNSTILIILHSFNSSVFSVTSLNTPNTIQMQQDTSNNIQEQALASGTISKRAVTQAQKTLVCLLGAGPVWDKYISVRQQYHYILVHDHFDSWYVIGLHGIFSNKKLLIMYQNIHCTKMACTKMDMYRFVKWVKWALGTYKLP
jgi:hypothetical protein